ncbi:unnamed protein product, partial [Rhizoctonia solani]
MSTSVTIANTGAGDISSINNITESLGGIKLEDIKTEGCSGGDSDSDPSEESQSNSDSTGNTSLGQGLQLRPRSPASKGDLPEMTWEAAQLLLHHRLFFWNCEVNDFPILYCWGISYVPIAMGIQAESQLWYVSLSNSWIPARLQLHERRFHRDFKDGQADLMGHLLVLPDRSSDPRFLFRNPETPPLWLHKDIASARCEFQFMSNQISTSHMVEGNISSYRPVESPEANPNLGRNPMFIAPSNRSSHWAPAQGDPSLNQEYWATGVVGAEGAFFSSGYSQLPGATVLLAPADASNMVSNEVPMKMELGSTPPTIDEITNFTTNFRKEAPGKGAQVVICLHCPPNDERRRITDVRPWNLRRHLMIDFVIK